MGAFETEGPRLPRSRRARAPTQWRLALVVATISAPPLSAHAECVGALQDGGTVWTPGSAGLPPLAPGSDALRAYFGHTIAVGDFNGDGKDDIAIAHRQLAVTASVNAGAVVVLQGGAGGLSAAGSRTLLGGNVDANSQPGFGDAMAVADFNADGFDDLAVGAAGRGLPVAGKVYLFSGGALGLDPLHAQVWDRSVEGIEGDPGNEDGFGTALVAGDFDGDAFDDLAIAAGRGFEPAPVLHRVAHVIFGSAQGLQAGDAVALEFPAQPGASDDIALRTAVDTNADGSDELLVTFQVSLPQVAPLACLAHSLRTASVAWSCFGTQSFPADPGGPDPGAIATGDFNDDGRGDIAFGQNRFTVDGRARAGRAQVWLGGGAGVGVLAPDFQVLASTVADSAGSMGQFGTNLVAADIDGDGRDDLVIGEPGHSATSGIAGAGLLHTYRGSGAVGLVPLATIPPAQVAALLPLETSLGFGTVLGTGDFDGNGCPDVAAAMPSRRLGALTQAGAVAILRGGQPGLLQDGFED